MTTHAGRTVTMRALIQRINRKLAAQEEVLKVTRGEKWRGEFGDYYAIDLRTNAVMAKHVDPEE